MRSLLYSVAVGLVGAGIVHIAVLLLVPEFSERDAWSKLQESGQPPYRMTRIDNGAAAGLVHRSADPLFYVAACRFDLEEGYAHVTAPGRVPYWSVSVYDRSGQNIYSFNDRTATTGQLDFVVLTPAQMADVRKELPEALVSSVFVEADMDEGIALVRVFAPDESWAPGIANYVDAMICRHE